MHLHLGVVFPWNQTRSEAFRLYEVLEACHGPLLKGRLVTSSKRQLCLLQNSMRLCCDFLTGTFLFHKTLRTIEPVGSQARATAWTHYRICSYSEPHLKLTVLQITWQLGWSITPKYEIYTLWDLTFGNGTGSSVKYNNLINTLLCPPYVSHSERGRKKAKSGFTLWRISCSQSHSNRNHDYGSLWTAPHYI